VGLNPSDSKHSDAEEGTVMKWKVLGITAYIIFATATLTLAQLPEGFPSTHPGLDERIAALHRKMLKIGYLSLRSGIEPRDEVFRERLHELGYIEGKNFAIEWRFYNGKTELLDQYAAELVRLKVDALFGNNTPTIMALKKATTTIPIVMIAGADPAESGLVKSAEWPGGNITGLTSASSSLNGKRLELAKEVIPELARAAVLLDPVYPTITSGRSLNETQSAAAALGLKLQALEVRSVDDLANAFRAASDARAQALIHFSHAVITNNRKQVVELALKYRLPAIYADRQFMDVGGLMSLGADPLDLVRRAAGYVDKILKGANPAEMAMEKPIKFELLINATAAKQIGLNIPETVLKRADKIIW
jgi:putative tryptophan/tyrosine transport system substrate-binding protein